MGENELERMLMEAVVEYFKYVYCNFPRKTEETQGK